VTTGSVPGIRLSGDSLATWKEALVPFRSRNSTQFHNAAWIGWNNRIAGDDTTKVGRPAAYEISLGDSLRSAWRIDGQSALVFSLAVTDAKPGPRQPARDTTKRDTTKKATPARRPPARRPSGPDTTAVDLSVELVDAAGASARVPLSTYGPIRRPVESYIYRRAGRDKLRFGSLSEIVLQTYVIPFEEWRRVSPSLNLDRVTKVRLVFDKTPVGSLILDNIGFSRISRDFLIANGSGQ
jgi:hypothetical protein